MAPGEVVGQFKLHPGFHPPGVVPRHAQFDGESIHRAEFRFQLLVHQQIGVVIQ